ncbi:MAG TPA: hypothetical protein VES79_14800 [Solirubrobacteraceae bacterium]|nr:hypothetical protein [Solirubrobacteraceae bacterium]
MPRRLCLTALLVLLALAAAAPGAHAGWFPAEPIDGPAVEIERLGGVDLARDGTGGLVYIKRIGGVSHVMLSRHVGGAWRPPEQVDVGVPEGATEAAIAVADRHRIAVVWIAGSKLFGSVVQGNDEQPGPLMGPAELFSDPSGAVSDLSVDMGINGTAYATFSGPGGGGADVAVLRLQDLTWQGVGGPLDIDPAQAAGRAGQRARVAVSAEGNALVVWGEDHPDGRPRVYGRRVTGVTPSAAPQELSLNEFQGQLGGRADSPDVDIEDDGSFAWAVFRQDFGGGSRSIARRLLGSQFEAPVGLDAGPSTSAPRIAMNGRGIGAAALETGGGVIGGFLNNDAFGPGLPLSSQGSTQGTAPVVAASEHREVAVAWRVADVAGAGSIHARFRPDGKPLDGEVTLSRGELGIVEAGQYAAASDRLAGMVVAMIQGAKDGPRSIAVAVNDRPPGPPGGQTTGTYQRRSRPTFKWRPGLDLWGSQRFRVVVDGQAIGETAATTLVPPTALASGRPHAWRVISIDRRGQGTPSKERFIRIDAAPARVVVRVEGKRRRGQSLKISVTGLDGQGSGIDYVLVEYGDRASAKQFKQFRGSHRYRKGSFRLKVKVVDRAGNATRKTVRLRIK